MPEQPEIESLITRHYPALQRIAASHEANTALREELVQDMLESIWRSWSKFRGESSPKTYILRIAYYRAARHIEKQMRRLETNVEQTVESVDPQHPEQNAEQQQQINQLLYAIHRLPIVQKQLITMSFDGLSYQEMAEVTGLSISNVGVRLNRAKATLKKLLEHHYAN